MSPAVEWYFHDGVTVQSPRHALLLIIWSSRAISAKTMRLAPALLPLQFHPLLPAPARLSRKAGSNGPSPQPKQSIIHIVNVWPIHLKTWADEMPGEGWSLALPGTRNGHSQGAMGKPCLPCVSRGCDPFAMRHPAAPLRAESTPHKQGMERHQTSDPGSNDSDPGLILFLRPLKKCHGDFAKTD